MLFNSPEFIIFFPLCTALYFLIPYQFRWIHLLIASCIFYASFIPAYLLILLFLIIIDYTAGLLIEGSAYKKWWLIVSIGCNLAILGFFKYYNFFIINMNELTGAHILLLKLVLPIGLSFHTFQSMSYTIEVYRGKQEAVRHFGYYALYVMFYPQLVAGPIERPQHLLPQLFKPPPFSAQKLQEGLRLMAWGFFKKLVVADRIGPYADMVFNNPKHCGVLSLWLGIFFFGIQIYADFSGYTDIAIGAARCMGIDLTLNFNRPYQSTNIRQFWKRWHMSLSGWFRDYVYIPLGGNRRKGFRNKINLIITFVLSAVWHGAGWTFLIWGLLHGSYVLIYDSFKKHFTVKIPKSIAWLMTAFCISIAWIFFRAASLTNAVEIIRNGLRFSGLSLNYPLTVPGAAIQFGNFDLLFSFCMIIFMFVIEKLATPKLINLNLKIFADTALFISTIWLIIFFGVFHRSGFIYFQF